MFHGNKNKVAEDFQKNKQQKHEEVNLVDPLEIKIDAQPNHTEAQSDQSRARELSIKRIKFRLTHEKKTIVFKILVQSWVCVNSVNQFRPYVSFFVLID